MYSKHISVKQSCSRENTHIVESLNKVCDILMQNTTITAYRFIESHYLETFMIYWKIVCHELRVRNS